MQRPGKAITSKIAPDSQLNAIPRIRKRYPDTRERYPDDGG